jgi:hypothetical protein
MRNKNDRRHVNFRICREDKDDPARAGDSRPCGRGEGVRDGWAHGPVVPSVFHVYKDRQWSSIETVAAASVDQSIVGYLEAVFEKFGKFGAKQLEKLTHEHDPWKITRGDLRPEQSCNRPIDKKLMRDFYAKRIKKTWKSAPVRA